MALNAAQARIIDPVLSNVMRGFKHPEHVGMHLFPEVPVNQRGGKVIEFGKESFRLYRTLRAPGAATQRIDVGYGTQDFALQQHALEGKLPIEHQQEAQAVPGIDLAEQTLSVVSDALALRLEFSHAQLARDTTKYDANHKVDLAAAKWSVDTNNPTADVEAGKEAVRSTIGIYPNVAVLGPKAFSACKNNALIVDRFKYTGRDSITTDMLQALWEVERVVVGKAVFADDAGNFIDVWGSDVILAYAPPAARSVREPSFGYTYNLRGYPLVEPPYYDRSSKSWIYPVTGEHSPYIVGAVGGYLIQNAA